MASNPRIDNRVRYYDERLVPISVVLAIEGGQFVTGRPYAPGLPMNLPSRNYCARLPLRAAERGCQRPR